MSDYYAGLTFGGGRALSILQLVAVPTTEPPTWNRATGRMDTRLIYHAVLARRLSSDVSLSEAVYQVNGILRGEPINGRVLTLADVGAHGRPLAMVLYQTLPQTNIARIDESATVSSHSTSGYLVPRSELSSAVELMRQKHQDVIKVAPSVERKLNADRACLDALGLALWWAEHTQARDSSGFVLQFRRDAGERLRIKTIL